MWLLLLVFWGYYVEVLGGLFGVCVLWWWSGWNDVYEIG